MVVGWMDGMEDVKPGKKEDPLIARRDIKPMLSSQFSCCCFVESLFLLFSFWFELSKGISSDLNLSELVTHPL